MCSKEKAHRAVDFGENQRGEHGASEAHAVTPSADNPTPYSGDSPARELGYTDDEITSARHNVACFWKWTRANAGAWDHIKSTARTQAANDSMRRMAAQELIESARKLNFTDAETGKTTHITHAYRPIIGRVIARTVTGASGKLRNRPCVYDYVDVMQGCNG